MLPTWATSFRQAAEEGGRHPAGLTVVVPASIALIREPLDGRPFLSGSPRQIAGDVARREPADVDQILLRTWPPVTWRPWSGSTGDPGGRRRRLLRPAA